jgi:hypothetical protein
MNEKLDTAMPEELEEAPTLRLEDLRNADLKEKDLTKVKGLLPEHLAGADLTAPRCRTTSRNFRRSARSPRSPAKHARSSSACWPPVSIPGW